ncbi:hypothetical protein OEZ60_16110 [Defluviimonas sp. WL0024]|uniref:Uncharacterized protein n=2 Tax=Albidovulum TaxID=205889 RepID=A0ABT3J332_9RHOB|nr:MULTISPECIES: hypothetical protein [Defluviimonas]MCU9849526.1 hypothetical protein [Defluviimonas sp. WL0024]MCW3782092.1 hypothetical protein [Defluviimonas salinarum]
MSETAVRFASALVRAASFWTRGRQSLLAPQWMALASHRDGPMPGVPSPFREKR